MKFTVGQSVYIKKLKQIGTIVSISGKDTATVSCNNLKIRCKADELEAPGKHKKTTTAPAKDLIFRKKSRGQVPSSIDLHGFSAQDAAAAVESLISNAILAGVKQIEVVHGRGSGKVQKSVHKLLSETDVVKGYRLDSLNPGTTWVYL